MQLKRKRNNPRLFVATLLVSLLFASPLYAQYRIYGQVLDRKTKEALPFAVVTYGTSGQGLLTDVSGYYSITTHQPITTLQVSHLGYRKRTFRAKITVLNRLSLPQPPTPLYYYSNVPLNSKNYTTLQLSLNIPIWTIVS